MFSAEVQQLHPSVRYWGSRVSAVGGAPVGLRMLVLADGPQRPTLTGMSLLDPFPKLLIFKICSYLDILLGGAGAPPTPTP